jgi:outer membrane protein OmpA-like peptidoglycan-associated protein
MQEQQLMAERQARMSADEALKKISGVQVSQSDKGTVLTISGNVLFETGKSTLMPRSQDRLKEVAEALKDDKRKLMVVGHTDSTGKEDMNQRLSESRAKSVQKFLVKEGLPEDRVQAEGMGEEEPIATNATPEGRANNRRVEIVLEEKSKAKTSPQK